MYCLNNKYIYQEANYGNCAFVGYDNEDIPKYARLRSTGYKSFKGDATGVAAARELGALLYSKGYETSISQIPQDAGKDMNDFFLTCLG